MKKETKPPKAASPRRGRATTKRAAPPSSSDVVPSFVAGQNLNEKSASQPAQAKKENPAAPQNLLEKVAPKEPVRARLTFGRIFQNLAYACLFIGIVALLGTVVAAIIVYWPQNQSSLPASPVDQSMVVTSGNSWVWIVMTGGIPGFLPILQIVVVVAAILIILWGWRAAVRVTRRLVVRIADQFLWPLSLVEPLLLVVVWCLVIIGAWLLVAPEYFLSLSIVCGVLLVFGLICFWIMRSFAGSRLDMTRADLDFYKYR